MSTTFTRRMFLLPRRAMVLIDFRFRSNSSVANVCNLHSSGQQHKGLIVQSTSWCSAGTSRLSMPNPPLVVAVNCSTRVCVWVALSLRADLLLLLR